MSEIIGAFKTVLIFIFVPVMVVIVSFLLLLLLSLIPGFPIFLTDKLITAFVNLYLYLGLPLGTLLAGLYLRRILKK